MYLPPGTERDTVVLVDPSGAVLGEASKLDAHRPPGHLHLAFSVVLYDDAGAVLLQQRAAGKYHFALYWANACCSHPAPGEDIAASAARRVTEELGLDCELTAAGTFRYQASCPSSGLVERELDHVFAGRLAGTPRPDPCEVADLVLVDPEEVFSGRFAGPLTPWLAPALRLAARVGAP